MTTPQETPSDLIPMNEAIVIAQDFGLGRRWIEGNVKRYVLRNRINVSRSALEQALRDYNTPKPVEGQGDDK